MLCKVCTVCRVEKALADFDKNIRCADGHFMQCKACRRAKRNAAARRERLGASAVPFEERPHVSFETPAETHFRMLKRSLRWGDIANGQTYLW